MKGGTVIHIGIAIDYLALRIQEVGNRGFITRDEKTLSSAEALTWLASQQAQGRDTISSCPSPDTTGRCSGHHKEREI